MNRTDARPDSDQQPGLPIEAVLASVEDQADTSRPLTAPPFVFPNPRAVSKYHALGELDARNPGVDQHTGPNKPTQPSARLVITAARSPLTALGDRFALLHAAYADGTLGHVSAPTVRLGQILSHMAGLITVLGLLAVAAIITEVVYGKTATELLTGAEDNVALAAAIALSLGVNGAALVAGGWLHKTHPSVVRRHGVKVASVIAVIVASVALALGLVIGGYDSLTFDTVTGGGATTVTDQTDLGRPLLTATYTLVLVLVAIAMATGHLLLVDGFETHRVELISKARATAEAQTLGPTAVRELIQSLGLAYLSAIAEAHRQGRLRVETYNAAFRRAAHAELAELFDDVTYDDQEPAWARDVHSLLEQVSHHNRSANITRIA